MALVESGRPRGGILHLTRAVQLQPDFLEARNNLGILLARAGRLEGAIAQFRAALAIAPGSAEVRKNLDFALARGASASGGLLGNPLSRDRSDGAGREEADRPDDEEHSDHPAR